MATEGNSEGGSGQPILVELKTEEGSTLLQMVAPVGMNLPAMGEGGLANLQQAMLQALQQSQPGQLNQLLMPAPLQLQTAQPTTQQAQVLPQGSTVTSSAVTQQTDATRPTFRSTALPRQISSTKSVPYQVTQNEMVSTQHLQQAASALAEMPTSQPTGPKDTPPPAPSMERLGPPMQHTMNSHLRQPAVTGDMTEGQIIQSSQQQSQPQTRPGYSMRSEGAHNGGVSGGIMSQSALGGAIGNQGQPATQQPLSHITPTSQTTAFSSQPGLQSQVIGSVVHTMASASMSQPIQAGLTTTQYRPQVTTMPMTVNTAGVATSAGQDKPPLVRVSPMDGSGVRSTVVTGIPMSTAHSVVSQGGNHLVAGTHQGLPTVMESKPTGAAVASESTLSSVSRAAGEVPAPNTVLSHPSALQARQTVLDEAQLAHLMSTQQTGVVSIQQPSTLSGISSFHGQTGLVATNGNVDPSRSMTIAAPTAVTTTAPAAGLPAKHSILIQNHAGMPLEYTKLPKSLALQTQAELQQRQSELQEQLRHKLAQLQSLELQQQDLQQMLAQGPMGSGDTTAVTSSSTKLTGMVSTSEYEQRLTEDRMKVHLQHQVQQQIQEGITDNPPTPATTNPQPDVAQPSRPEPPQLERLELTQLKQSLAQALASVPSPPTPNISLKPPLADIAHLVGPPSFPAVTSSMTSGSLSASTPAAVTSVSSASNPDVVCAHNSYPTDVEAAQSGKATQEETSTPTDITISVPPPIIQMLPVQTSMAPSSTATQPDQKVIRIEMIMPPPGTAGDLGLTQTTTSQVVEVAGEKEDAQQLTQAPPQPVMPRPVFSDKKLWCEDCGASVRVICRVHGAIAKVRDRIIPCRAKLTAPHHISIKTLELRAGGKHIMGAFAKKVIQKRTEFGPFEGDLLDNWPHMDKDYFVVKLIHEDGQTQYYDSGNQLAGNWMIYVRPAHTREEQNMVAYQYKGRVYFTTIEAIPPNAELRVWYGGAYARALGMPLLGQKAGSTAMEEMMPVELNSPEVEDASEDEGNDGDNLVINDNEDSGTVEVEIAAEVMEEIMPDGDEEPESNEVSLKSEEGWQCAACLTTFPTPLGLEIHECIVETQTAAGRRTRSKRKGHPVKLATPLKKSLKEEPVEETPKRRRGRPRKHPLPEEIEEQPSEMAMPTTPEKLEEPELLPPPQPQMILTVNQAQMAEKNEQSKALLEEAPLMQVVADSPVAGLPDNTTVIAPLPPEMMPPSLMPSAFEDLDDSKAGRKPKVIRKKLREPQELFSCPNCTKAFSSEGKLRTHMFVHTGEKPFPCKYPGCLSAFTTRFKLMRHELIHNGDKCHACPYCERTFLRKDHLKNHLRIHDPNKVLHHCTRCDKEYASPFAYKTHIAFHAADEGELICLVCKDEYPDTPTLMKHLKVHAGARSVKEASEKNQVCPLCNKCFFTRKDVKRHLVVHTKDRDFLCQFCPQRFGRRDHLVRHLKKAHSKEAENMPLDCESDITHMLMGERLAGDEDGSSHMVSQLLHSVAQGMLEPLVGAKEDGSGLQGLGLQPGIGISLSGVPTSNTLSVSNNLGGIPVSFLTYPTHQTVNSASQRQFTPTFDSATGEQQVMAAHFVPPSYVPENNDSSGSIAQPIHYIPTDTQFPNIAQLKSLQTVDSSGKPVLPRGSQMVINYTVKQLMDQYANSATPTSNGGSSE